MAYINFQPKDNFHINLWTGNSTTDRAMTGIGFKPDLLWIKGRNEGTDHELNDAVRGSTKYLNSNDTGVEATEAESVKSFDADGYTLGNANYWNWTAKTFVGWSWKAGTTTGLSGGTITPTAYSINTTAGFGIYQYDGNSTSGATIAHGLGVAPQMVIVKCLDAAENWTVGHTGFGFTKWMPLDTSGTPTATSVIWNDTAPDATNITLGNNSLVNTHTTRGYVMYAFAPIKGYSAFGKYVGNNDADGPFCYTGFQPAWVCMKRVDSSENWTLYDNQRLGYNPQTFGIRPNLSNIESEYSGTSGARGVDFLSNGFKIREDGTNMNANNGDYIYMAFAKQPLVSSNEVAGVVR